jgi:hypothetical protein
MRHPGAAGLPCRNRGRSKSGNRSRCCLAHGPPGRNVRFSDDSLSRHRLIVEIRPFVRANKILSCPYLDFNLSRRYCNTASIGTLAHAEATARIADIYGAHLDLQFFSLRVLDVEKSIPSQHFDARRFCIGDGHAAVTVQADVDMGGCRDDDALSGNGFVQPRRKRLRNKPGQESEKQPCGGDGEMDQETVPPPVACHDSHIAVLMRHES